MSQSVFLPNYTIGTDAYEKQMESSRIWDKSSADWREDCTFKGRKQNKSSFDTGNRGCRQSLVRGNSTYGNIEQLIQHESVQKADVLFAVGGGRACDTVKVIGEKLAKPVFTFPTIGSNCSPVTAVCVIYNEEGVMDGLFFPSKPPVHTFIDTAIIAEAPDKYLWAGIGDALSKEVESTFSARGDDLGYTDRLGIQIGKMCIDRLLTYGTQALKDSADDRPSYAIEQVVSDIIVTTGLVSVLVNNNYNSAMAHSFYYGTTVLEKMEGYLHGASVSYGVLTLLMMDQQFDLFDKIYVFMKRTNFQYR